MRASTVGWIFTAGIAVGHVRGVFTSPSNIGDDSEDSIISNLGQSVQKVAELAQNVIVTVFTSESIEVAGEQDVIEDGDTINTPELKQHVQIITKTSESAVTIAHPKITLGPSLGKRKIGSNRWDLIHDGIQGQKRDATECPASFQLCPKSLNGGCCPNDRVCGSSSCLPTSAAPASACGMSGYIACGASDGGGCCPGGFLCGQAGCSPSAGVSVSQTCGANSYLCAASFGGGCCKNGMGCGVKTCYATSISTFTLLETITTTDASSNPVTVTNTKVTATTPVTPTATVSSNEDLVPKLPSSAVPVAKTEATSSPSSGSSGITTPMIGGIIGGSIGFLIIILIVATLIIRSLNKVVKVTEATNSRTSSSGPRSGLSRPRAPPRQSPDVDQMSVDPLMMTPSEFTGSVQRPSYQSSNLNSSPHEIAGDSPLMPVFNNYSPFSPLPPSHTHYPGGYKPVSTSDSPQNGYGYGRDRAPSLETSPPSSVNPNGGYFDLPIQSNRVSQGSLARRPSAHGRNWSNASDQSNVSQMSDPVELEATPDDGRRSSLSRALYGLGMGGMSRIVSRRRGSSDSNTSPSLQSGPSKRTPPWQTPASPTALGHIPEASESQYHVDATTPAPNRPPTRQRGLSGSQLREAGLSNSQLREMTMFEANPYGDEIAPAKPTPKDYDDEDLSGEGKSRVYG